MVDNYSNRVGDYNLLSYFTLFLFHSRGWIMVVFRRRNLFPKDVKRVYLEHVGTDHCSSKYVSYVSHNSPTTGVWCMVCWLKHFFMLLDASPSCGDATSRSFRICSIVLMSLFGCPKGSWMEGSSVPKKMKRNTELSHCNILHTLLFTSLYICLSHVLNCEKTYPYAGAVGLFLSY